MENGRKHFYAMRRGCRPGIYTKWEDAQLQVEGFSDNEHKSFRYKSDAEAWLGQIQEDPNDEEHMPHHPELGWMLLSEMQLKIFNFNYQVVLRYQQRVHQLRHQADMSLSKLLMVLEKENAEMRQMVAMYGDMYRH
ncbi:hypothetical protein AHAS_Ahas15G0151300 [Arachis hypogaea]